MRKVYWYDPDPRISKYVVITTFVIIFVGILSNFLTPPGIPEFEVPTVKSLYPIAWEKATAWEPDAQFTSAILDVRSSSDDEEFYNYGLYFESPSQRTSLGVFIIGEPPEYQISFIERDIPPDQEITPPIAIEELAFDSDLALDLLMQNGGDGFLQRNGGGASLNHLQLERLNLTNGWEPVVWRLGLSGVNTSLEITIDAERGELVKIRVHGRKEQEYFFGDEIKTIRLSPGEWVMVTEQGIMNLGEPYRTGLTYQAQLSVRSANRNTTHPEVGYGWSTFIGGNDITVITANSDYFEVEVVPYEKWFQTFPEGGDP